MPRSKLTSKGQTTIPLPVRERLGLRYGDAVDFVFKDDGSVALRSVKRDVLSLEGILYKPGRRAVLIEEMNEAIRETAVKRHLKSMASSSRGRTSTPRCRTKRRP
jgi:AbrB family looped-hinge helix DNA binding protein